MRQCLSAEAVSEKTEMTNADEALGQDMQKESAQELSTSREVGRSLRLTLPDILICSYELLFKGEREIRIISSLQKQFEPI